MEFFRKLVRFIQGVANAIVFGAWAFVVFVTVAGVWIASALAAYLNGPVWLPIVAGLVLFPGLPLTWELWAWRKHRRRDNQRLEKNPDAKRRRRWIPMKYRVVLRTFFLNLFFLFMLLVAFPSKAYLAMSTHGDWFLDAFDASDDTRMTFLSAAGGLEWMYEAKTTGDFSTETPVPAPSVSQAGSLEIAPPAEPTEEPANEVPEERVAGRLSEDAPRPPQKKPRPKKKDGIEIVRMNPNGLGTEVDEPEEDAVRRPKGQPRWRWPLPNKLHPLAKSVPAAEATSYQSVARYITERVEDPFERIKALNDWVAQHVSYDYESLARGEYPSQHPENVFRTKKAVCAGYAKLFAAMGRVTGDEIVYLGGEVRKRDDLDEEDRSHAWNAVKIKGKWYLVDVTWNDPKDSYRTDYLFIPPEAMITTHFPDDKGWQLLDEPISRARFHRQPDIGPQGVMHRLTLLEPTRSHVDVAYGTARLKFSNPRGKDLRAHVYRGDERIRKCEVEHGSGSTTDIRCQMPRKGRYEIRVEVASARWWHYVGRVYANAR